MESSCLPPGHLGLFQLGLEKSVVLVLAVRKGFPVRFVRWNTRVYASLKTLDIIKVKVKTAVCPFVLLQFSKFRRTSENGC